jgi:hypothetical protein
MRMTMLWRSSAHGSYGQRLQHLPGNLPSSTPPLLGDQLNTSPHQCSYPIVSEAWQRRWVGRFQEGHHDSWKASCSVRMGNVWKCVFPLCTYFKMASKGCEFQSLALPESPNDEFMPRLSPPLCGSPSMLEPNSAWWSSQGGLAQHQFLAIRIVLHVPEAYYEGRVFQAVGQALQIVHVVLAQCFAFQKPFILICSANGSSNISTSRLRKVPTIPHNPI